MTRALKNLLLWLLISLLPIQGMAVVMSASCGQAAAASVQHAAMAHHAAPAHCPSDSVDQTSNNASDAASDAASDKTSDSAATHHASCSACAACCVGASAPPSTPAAAAGHAMSESRFTALGMHGSSFIPTGLERPPRFS
jgi:hypothetical protein